MHSYNTVKLQNNKKVISTKFTKSGKLYIRFYMDLQKNIDFSEIKYSSCFRRHVPDHQITVDLDPVLSYI